MTASGRGELGRAGEDEAARFLESQGYRVVERNWRTARGEIDIIARRGSTAVFVEVKTRRTSTFGAPEESVTPAKARRIRALAAEYLSGVAEPLEVRFDVLSIDASVQEGPGRMLHIEDAF